MTAGSIPGGSCLGCGVHRPWLDAQLRVEGFGSSRANLSLLLLTLLVMSPAAVLSQQTTTISEPIETSSPTPTPATINATPQDTSAPEGEPPSTATTTPDVTLTPTPTPEQESPSPPPPPPPSPSPSPPPPPSPSPPPPPSPPLPPPPSPSPPPPVPAYAILTPEPRDPQPLPPPPSPQEDDQGGTGLPMNLIVIAGSCVGAVLLVALLVGGCLLYRKWSDRHKRYQSMQQAALQLSTVFQMDDLSDGEEHEYQEMMALDGRRRSSDHDLDL